MRGRLVWGLTLAGVVSVAVISLRSQPSAWDGQVAEHAKAWGMDKMWEDGLAEVGHYHATRMRYGKLRTYEAVLVVVKEDFDTRRYVKADPPYEGRPLLGVLKLNHAFTMPTDNYKYHYLASVFVRRDNPLVPVKMTVGSQEWCGNTFQWVKLWDRPTYHAHSYFDPEGEVEFPLDWRPGDLLEDQLPVAVRALRMVKGYQMTARIWPTMIKNKVGKRPTPTASVLRVVGEDSVKDHTKKRWEAWRIEVEMGSEIQMWWVAKEFPHVLIKHTAPDGRSLLLKSVRRYAYWQ